MQSHVLNKTNFDLIVKTLLDKNYTKSLSVNLMGSFQLLVNRRFSRFQFF